MSFKRAQIGFAGQLEAMLPLWPSDNTLDHSESYQQSSIGTDAAAAGPELADQFGKTDQRTAEIEHSGNTAAIASNPSPTAMAPNTSK